jgi:DNA invertase Pin-like site-specific DNA recombinase
MKSRRAAIYARVSTDGQTTTNQIQELREAAVRNGWTVVHEFIDRGISGAKGREHRPAFESLWQGVGRKDFDVVMVWAVDRLGRSLQHLVNFLTELHAKKVDLFIHRQGIDTTTPGGKAMFGMLGIFAEFERSMIQERVKAGIKRVRKGNPGKLWGRRPLTIAQPGVVDRIRALRREGCSMRAIADQVGVSSRTVWKIVTAGGGESSSQQPDPALK